MTANESDDDLTEDTTEAGEEESTGRGPAVALSVLGLVATWRVVTVAPEVAYVAVGALGHLGWQKFQARRAGSGPAEVDGTDEVEAPDIAEALRRLVGDDNGVLLTRLRDDLKLPDTKVVKTLLDEAGIQWKAVRTKGGNGPGVHKNDIPTVAPSPVADGHGNGCCCRSDDNNNGDNARNDTLGEGIRVERTDSGLIIRALDEPTRHGSART